MAIWQLCPTRFQIGFDDWSIFRKREVQAAIGIDMAIRKVVYNLPKRPSSGSVGGVQLGIRDVLECHRQPLGQGGNGVNPSLTHGVRHVFWCRELADWVLKLLHVGRIEGLDD